eukprot:g4626.t1
MIEAEGVDFMERVAEVGALDMDDTALEDEASFFPRLFWDSNTALKSKVAAAAAGKLGHRANGCLSEASVEAFSGGLFNFRVADSSRKYQDEDSRPKDPYLALGFVADGFGSFVKSGKIFLPDVAVTEAGTWVVEPVLDRLYLELLGPGNLDLRLSAADAIYLVDLAALPGFQFVMEAGGTIDGGGPSRAVVAAVTREIMQWWAVEPTARSGAEDASVDMDLCHFFDVDNMATWNRYQRTNLKRDAALLAWCLGRAAAGGTQLDLSALPPSVIEVLQQSLSGDVMRPESSTTSPGSSLLRRLHQHEKNADTCHAAQEALAFIERLCYFFGLFCGKPLLHLHRVARDSVATCYIDLATYLCREDRPLDSLIRAKFSSVVEDALWDLGGIDFITIEKGEAQEMFVVYENAHDSVLNYSADDGEDHDHHQEHPFFMFFPEPLNSIRACDGFVVISDYDGSKAVDNMLAHMRQAYLQHQLIFGAAG